MSKAILEKAIRTKTSLLAGEKTVVIGWSEVAAGLVMEALAARFDLVAVDLQHGLIDFDGAVELLSCSHRFDIPALCRVPSMEPGLIGRLLDAGYLGIIGPMIETEDEARALVRASSYPPLGGRSFGPIRARRVYGDDYGASANSAVMRIAMVETKKGVDNLEAILAVEGIDGTYIGPSDLALSMGLTPATGPDTAEVKEAMELIRRRTAEVGKIPGIHCSSGLSARQKMEEGYSFIGLGTDIGLLEHGISQFMKDLGRETIRLGKAGAY